MASSRVIPASDESLFDSTPVRVSAQYLFGCFRTHAFHAGIPITLVAAKDLRQEKPVCIGLADLQLLVACGAVQPRRMVFKSLSSDTTTHLFLLIGIVARMPMQSSASSVGLRNVLKAVSAHEQRAT